MKKLTAFFLLSIMALTASAQIVKIRHCLIKNGTLTEMEIDYDQSTGNKTIVVDGQRKNLEDVYPSAGAGYAANQKWFINNDTVKLNGADYIKYGLPRILSTWEVEATSAFSGVNVYKEAGLNEEPQVIYIPVRSGCEFQPYQKVAAPCNVAVKQSAREIRSGNTVSFTATTTLKQKLNYSWQVDNGEIVSGKNSSKLVVSTKGKKGELIVFLTATGDNHSCESFADATVVIK